MWKVIWIIFLVKLVLRFSQFILSQRRQDVCRLLGSLCFYSDLSPPLSSQKLYFVFLLSKQIFHSGDSDIEWLQRDLGLYVVNMFDTYQAAKVLSYPKLGLSYLLKKFCNVESNKKFQLYDWRIRYSLLKSSF